MNLAELTREQFYKQVEDLRVTTSRLVYALQQFDAPAAVFVFCEPKEQYVNVFDFWQEGHDHRKFISLEYLTSGSNNTPHTVGSLIHSLETCYPTMSREDSADIFVHVHNENGEMTTNFSVEQRVDGVYLIGLKPFSQYFEEFNELQEAKEES